MYRVEEITDESRWEAFFNENGSPSFLHSWKWGEFQKAQGQEILRLGLFNGKDLAAIALVEKIKAKRGNFLFIPHGPILHASAHATTIRHVLSKLLEYLTVSAKKEHDSFIRIAPAFPNTKEFETIFSRLKFQQAPIYLHSENFWVLDLSPSEEELLAGMRKTTRYLVRRATKDGVQIEKRTDHKAINEFMKIYEETVRREKFSGYSEKYIRNEFESFNKTGNALILLGKVGSSNDYLAGALLLFTKSSAFYHQGASIHSKIPVPYLLHWEGIREAKKRGCRFYNFWGVIAPGRTPKNWGGLTLFKQGFGGQQIDYLPTQDFIIRKKYYLTYLYEKYLGWRRGV